MSSVQEYCLVWSEWKWIISDGRGGASYTREKIEENYLENMRVFEDLVNEKLAEGWMVQGSPTIPEKWGFGGRICQALIRTKNVEFAVLALATSAIVAEQVTPLRNSNRLQVVNE